MDKDELTAGLEADGCQGTSNPDLIIFSTGKQGEFNHKLISKGLISQNWGQLYLKLVGKYEQKTGNSLKKWKEGPQGTVASKWRGKVRFLL